MLLKNILRSKKVFYPEDDNILVYLETNKDLKSKEGSSVITASYLIYHARQMQRNKKGKAIPQLILN